MDTLEKIIRIFTFIAIAIASVEVYLKINKIWRRKHQKVVAQSLSLYGLSLAIFTLIIWAMYFAIKGEVIAMVDALIYLTEASVLFIIGTGLWVKGFRQFNFWTRLKRMLSFERKEVDYLIKKIFKPSKPELIINILEQLAFIDDDLSDKEKIIIQAFAKQWDIREPTFDIDSYKKISKVDKYIRLYKKFEEYLSTMPPHNQATQMIDIMTVLINADNIITEEETVIYNELAGMIHNYLNNQDSDLLFHVLIFPQFERHFKKITEELSEAKNIHLSGGEAYYAGGYYSKDYSYMVCNHFRDLGLPTVVLSPDDDESFSITQTISKKLRIKD